MKKSVLIPLDGSPFSRQIVPHIRHVLDPEAYRLVLLQVAEPAAGMLGVPPPPFSSNWPLPVHAYATARDVERASHPIYASQQEHNTCAAIEAALSVEQAVLRDAGYAVSVSVRFGDPAEEIVACARDTDIDLVAMATHGRTGLRHLLMGSVAEQVLRRLTIPVLLVRPFAEETQEEGIMEQQILVPLDGSALAETVLPHAEALARANGYALLLLHVVTPSETSQTNVWIATAPAALRREWEVSRLTQIHAYLTAIATRLQAAELQVRTDVLIDHDPAAAIVERAKRDPAVSLIAIATHGRSGLSRWALGSVAAKVLHAATKPLLLWRAREASGAGIPNWRYRTILVPLDGSCFAEHALEPAQTIAAGSGSNLILVAAAPVVDDIALAEVGVVPYWMEVERAAEREHYDQYLKQVADRLAADGQRAHTRLVSGPPAEAIMHAADVEQADLIVMTTHGRSGLSRLWLGSVAAKVAQDSQVPVLLVRPQEALTDESQD